MNIRSLNSLVAIVSCIALPVAAEKAANAAEMAPDKSYTVELDGQAIGIDPGESVTAAMPDGRQVVIRLLRNPEILFKGNGFQFRHSSDYQVSNTSLADDVSQHLIVTGSGTLVLVQAYKSMNPTTLNQFMLEQVTGDDVKAGASIASAEATRTIANGITMTGLKAKLSTGSMDAEVEVMSAKTSYGGILAVSRIDQDFETEDRAFVEKFWSTLELQ